MPELAQPAAWRFDDLVLDPERGTLSRVHPDGQTTAVHIGSRGFQLLWLLVKRRGETVAYGEIMATVWPNVTVEQNNVPVQVATVRRVLDANGGRGSSIQNVPGRGYRFASQVSARSEADETNNPVQELPPPPSTVGHRDTTWRLAWSTSLPSRVVFVIACLLGLGALVTAMAFRGNGSSLQAESTAATLAPAFSPGEDALRRRLSVVVRPFENRKRPVLTA
jgi:DNA-binding winged helix-turn-helix (wHTH) protein